MSVNSNQALGSVPSIKLPEIGSTSQGGGGSKSTTIKTENIANQRFPQLVRQPGKISLISPESKEKKHVRFGSEDPRYPQDILVKELSDDGSESVKPHTVTLSSRRFPYALLSLVPEDQRSDSLKEFIQKHDEIVNEISDPSERKMALRIAPEFTMRLKLSNRINKRIIEAAEFARADYQPFLSRGEIRELNLSKRDSKISFDKEDITKVPIVRIYNRIWSEIANPKKLLLEGSELHKAVENQTSDNFRNRNNYSPILTVHKKTNRVEIILLTEGTTIVTLSKDPKSSKRMLLERKNITEANLCLKRNQLELTEEEKKQLYTSTMDFIKDSNIHPKGHTSVSHSYALEEQNCLKGTDKYPVDAETSEAQRIQLAQYRNEKILTANNAIRAGNSR